jgi:hypothetical protein
MVSHRPRIRPNKKCRGLQNDIAAGRHSILARILSGFEAILNTMLEHLAPNCTMPEFEMTIELQLDLSG